MIAIFTRIDGESFDAYASRLFRNAKEYGLDSNTICAILNSENGCTYTESAYRKYYTAFNRGRDFERQVVNDSLYDDEYLLHLRCEKEELQKAKVQFQDQRREYNKVLRQEARMEHVCDELVKAAQALPRFSIPVYLGGVTNEKEVIVFVNDIHYGMVTNNVFNEYSTDICASRLAYYASKVREFVELHQPQTMHIVLLGDLIHGSTHVGCRIASSENTVGQLMQISEMLACFMSDASKDVLQVYVHCSYGNHARTQQNKAESEHSDNLERLVPFWLRERFSNDPRFVFADSSFDGVICFDSLGWGFAATHGDREQFKKYGILMHTILSKQMDVAIDYAIMGDKHHTESFDGAGVETIICPAFCGTDDYANDHRLYSTPAQLMLCVTRDGGAEHRALVRFDKKTAQERTITGIE